MLSMFTSQAGQALTCWVPRSIETQVIRLLIITDCLSLQSPGHVAAIAPRTAKAAISAPNTPRHTDLRIRRSCILSMRKADRAGIVQSWGFAPTRPASNPHSGTTETCDSFSHGDRGGGN